MDRRTAFEDLEEDTCRCGRPKKRGQSFCRSCYYKLPRPMRRALYSGVGYADAYGSAVERLEGNQE